MLTCSVLVISHKEQKKKFKTDHSSLDLADPQRSTPFPMGSPKTPMAFGPKWDLRLGLELLAWS